MLDRLGSQSFGGCCSTGLVVDDALKRPQAAFASSSGPFGVCWARCILPKSRPCPFRGSLHLRVVGVDSEPFDVGPIRSGFVAGGRSTGCSGENGEVRGFFALWSPDLKFFLLSVFVSLRSGAVMHAVSSPLRCPATWSVPISGVLLSVYSPAQIESIWRTGLQCGAERGSVYLSDLVHWSFTCSYHGIWTPDPA